MGADKAYKPGKTPEALVYTELALTGISLCDGETNLYIPVCAEHEQDIIVGIAKYLHAVKRLIAHNWVYDAMVLKSVGLDISSIKRFDTMIAYHLLDENDNKGLKYLSNKLLGYEVEEFDPDLNHYSKEFCEYALNDTKYTYELYLYLLPKIFEQKLDTLFFDIEMPFQTTLLEMKIEGVLIDKKLLNKQQKILEDEILRLETQLYEELGEKYTMQLSLDNSNAKLVGDINFNSGQQLASIIYERLGLEISERTDTGKPKTDTTALKKHSGHPFIDLLMKYKIAKKLYDAFVGPEGQIVSNIEKDGKVRPQFRDTGTKTGRLSCTNPNLQQLPKPKEYSPVNVRDVFICPSGYKMFSCDYSGQEVAVAAQVSKDPTLVKALKNGYDMHLAIANQFYHLGIPEECLNKEHKDYEKYKNAHSDARGKAKVITFGLMYGKGAYGFSKDFNISEEEAQNIVDDYFNGMPKLRESIDKTHDELKRTGLVTNLAGRKRHFYHNEQGYYPGFAYRQSFNFLIQGFSADMIRAAMVTVQKNKSKYPEWGLTAVMTVHDEAVYIVKEEYVDKATKFVKKCFENVCKNFIVPVVADVEIGNNYGESK